MANEHNSPDLSDLRTSLLQAFGVGGVSQFGASLLQTVLTCDREKYHAYMAIAPDLNSDFLQPVYQYYLADRRDKKQDFTPASLAKLLAALVKDADEIVDMCAGSGALTIQAWQQNKKRKFTLYEIDTNVLPYLLFNLAVRNIGSTVYHMDVIHGILYAKYALIQDESFCKVEVEVNAEYKLDIKPTVQHEMEPKDGRSGQQLLLFT